MDDNNIWIGIAANSIRTKARVENTKGEILGHARSEGIKTHNLQNIWYIILNTTRKALQNIGINVDNKNYNFHIGIGIADITPQQIHLLTECSTTFSSIKINSELYTTCLGAHHSKNGAIILASKKCLGFLACDNECTQVGGWGFPYSNEGSAAWLGIEAIRLTLQAHDGRMSYSPLLQNIKNKFNNDINTLLDWAHHAHSSQFAELTSLIISHAGGKDPNALYLLKTAAHEIEKIVGSIEHHIPKSKKNKIDFCLIGHLAKSLEPFIDKKIHSKFIAPKGDALDGAILMLK